MKNIYIIAIRENGQEPILIKQKSRNDLTYLGNYKNAYFAESKEQAEQTREKRYKQREEKKADPIYKDTYF